MKIKHLLVAALLVFAGGASAQGTDQMPMMPVDSAVVVGHLDNGLTYYIRHNNYPAGKVNFYIAQKVGAIQEEDSQDGLAHFLEHMAFNGSTHFPDDAVVKFMDGIGGQWNAFTTADHTVYHINGVSNERQSVIDSCLLVLSDWSEGLTLTEDQIQTERDVVHNEYRSHSATQRILRASLADLFPNSQYGRRTVIGSMDVIDNSNPETLRSYYHKWYFPGNQAIVVVGDIEPAKIEASIKKLFGSLPVPKGATKAVELPVEDNEETLFSSGSDKEVTQTVYLIYRKKDVVTPEEKQTIPYLFQQDLEALINSMFNNRMMKISQSPESNLISASTTQMEYGMHARTRQSQMIQVLPKLGKEKEAFREIVREMNRVGQYGFTESEFKMAKESFKSSIDQTYNNRATITNDTYAQSLIDNFLNGEPYPTIEQTYPIHSQVVPMLPLAAVNEYAKTLINADGRNLAIVAVASEKDGKPSITKNDLMALLPAARDEKIEAYADSTKEEPMLAHEPVAGKIVSEKENKTLGFTELKLSNGAKVVLKKTDLKANEILFMATAAGGESIGKRENLATRKVFSGLLPIHGLGAMNFIDLVNVIQTKQTAIQPGVSNDLHYLNGQTNNENIETLMQMAYLSFTDVKKDDAFFQQAIQGIKAGIASKANDPEQVMNDSVMFYNHSQRAEVLSLDEDEIAQIDYDHIIELRKQLFKNPAEFTFTFVGSFDEATIRPLIEKYIASIPSDGSKSALEDNRFYTKGIVDRAFTMKMGNPQSITRDFFCSDKIDYTLPNTINVSALSQVLWNKMFEIIREKESAAYTPMPSAKLDNDLTGSYLVISSEVATNPEKTELANRLITEIISDIPTKVTDEDVQKAKESIAKSHADRVKTNEYWLDVLTDYDIYGVDKATDFDKELKAVSTKTVGDVARQILKSGNHVRVVLNAVKQ